MQQATMNTSTGADSASTGILMQIAASPATRLDNIAQRLRHTDVLIGTLVNHNDVNDETVSLLMCILENVTGARLVAEGQGEIH